MERKPFESLDRGLNRDLGILLDTEGSGLSKSTHPSLPSVLRMTSVPIGMAQGRDEFLGQHRLEYRSDTFAREIAIFPLANHVVINEFGAFIPQSIFGTETNLTYKEERNQNGAINITVHPTQPVLPAAKRPQFGSARDLIKISDDFDEPIRRDDPIFNIGRDPVACGISDASENLDKYLYGGE